MRYRLTHRRERTRHLGITLGLEGTTATVETDAENAAVVVPVAIIEIGMKDNPEAILSGYQKIGSK